MTVKHITIIPMEKNMRDAFHAVGNELLSWSNPVTNGAQFSEYNWSNWCNFVHRLNIP